MCHTLNLDKASVSNLNIGGLERSLLVSVFTRLARKYQKYLHNFQNERGLNTCAEIINKLIIFTIVR